MSTVKLLHWTEDRKPNNECGYNHCISETPFGRFLLTWKGWKTEPWQSMSIGFDETPWGEAWYEMWDTTDEAKESAYTKFCELIADCTIGNVDEKKNEAKTEHV